MRKIVAGYASLIRDMLNLGNDGSFLSLPAGMAVLTAICGMFGLIRNTLSVHFDILHGFYSFHPDILLTMFNFPIHLFLFPGAILHWLLRHMGYRRIRVESIFGLTFHLQILHLIVPFFDWFGDSLGMSWAYTIGTQIVRTRWYTNRIYMTPGIILGWWITAYLVAKVLRARFGIRWWTVIISSLITFLVILLPTYFFFPTLNTLFNHIFGLWFWNPTDYLFDSPSWFLHWGNGTYFAMTALLGALYFHWQQRGERGIST